MKRVARGVGGVVVIVVVGVVVALAVLSVTGLEPKERRPGLWLRGAVVTEPVTDWSFTDRYETIHLQTRTPYLLPHSVTVSCTAYDGRLYLTSVYRAGQRFPQDRAWNRNVVRDPHVRLQIGDRVYDRTLAVVRDPAERDAVLRAKARKYPRLRVPPTSTTYVFRVDPA